MNEDAEEPAEGTNTPQNTLTYVHGRLYVNEQKCWVFESLKTCFQGKDYPDIALTLAELYRDSNQEVKNYDKILADAQNSLKEMRKEKQLAAIEAAKKAQAKKKGKGKDAVAETPIQAEDETHEEE